MTFSHHERAADAAALRLRAEQRLRPEEKAVGKMSAAQMKEMIHELRVHQIELEMQNEQLRVTQSELEAAREKYVDLYDYAPVGFLTIGRNGIIRAANLTSVEMLGVERSKLLSTPFSQFVSKEDQETYYLCWRKVYESAAKQICELRLRRNGGAPAFHARLELISASENGEDVCRLGLSDITAQKRAEEDLRESQRRRLQYETDEWKHLAMDAGQLGAWDQDLRTGKITCSAQACAMLGFPANIAFDWKRFLERIHPKDRGAFLREIQKSAEPSGTRRCDAVFRIVLPEGPVHWLRFAARTFFADGSAGRPLRRTGILAEITRLKEAEELLESRAKQLEALVQERTARLQEAVSELEHLSYTLVHDLRAPLRAIAGYMNLLIEQLNNTSPDQRKFLERSYAAAVRMDNLIVDALSYNQVLRERFALAPVDGLVLLRQLIETYPEFQVASGSIIIEGPFPLVLGNPGLLTQCFSNLLANALKFVEPFKQPSVRVSTQEKQNRVRIWFQDNGIGISEEGQKRIFGMFQRLNRNYEGTGIGLALVRKAVERMGGIVGVESEPGHGSRFWLELEKARPEKEQGK